MNTHTHAIENPKKPYTSPRLITYGQVRSLTQSGASAGTENTGSKKKSMASDCMSKEHIVRIGVHPLGIGLYLFDYKLEYRDTWGHGRQFGVMAQEVEAVVPEAILVHPDGYKLVDYAMLGISHRVQ